LVEVDILFELNFHVIFVSLAFLKMLDNYFNAIVVANFHNY